MNECPNCGHRGVIGDSDFTFEDLGYDGEGVVSFYHCPCCEAEVTVAVPEKTQNGTAAPE